MTHKPADELLPGVLVQLGYSLQVHGDAEAILPPVRTVPAGSFLMGSDPLRDTDAWTLELPQHEVTTTAYDIATYPLTVVEYACAVRCGALEAPTGLWETWMNWSTQLQEPTYPVVTIPWFDALAYVRWLANVTGEPWRLPTEAEWEKAARGTDGRIYPWGDRFDPAMANTDEGRIKTGVKRIGRTTPVYAFAQGVSPYGVVDMIGNATEWCSSAFRPYPYDAKDGREDLDAEVSYRIARGGAYDDFANNARAATRWPTEPWKRGGPKGLRIARDHIK